MNISVSEISFLNVSLSLAEFRSRVTPSLLVLL